MKPARLAMFALTVALCGGAAFAQTYPAKPVRIVVTGVGSGGDFAARLIALGVSPALGQQIIVDNRGSGNMPILQGRPTTICAQIAPSHSGCGQDGRLLRCPP